MNFSRETSIGYLLNHLARLFSNALQQRIKPLGLSTGVFPVMIHLWENDGITQKQLVDLVGIEQATMANTLNRMERDGLVIRKKGPKDARERQVYLTELGLALRDPALNEASTQNEALLAGLTGAEQRQLISLASKLLMTLNMDSSLEER
ncbi:MarR family transcriptional regulator [uncultured Roseibium sp.]|uniref:MarR family winged helix-turn-helix transcriptional regulator n=1 Tax=uncultured Roseibium sp. TaxID=1936171 RepID=UPI002608DC84|nr:MarR family transcriptional regulator [uncultured Roseibium sp.]